MLLRRAACLALALAACGRARPVEFQGHPEPRLVGPDAVVESRVVPRGAERLGRLYVRCQPVSALEPFCERSLLDVDCSAHRLRRLLREAAAEHGGDVLVGLECGGGSTLTCRAQLARRHPVGTPRRAPVPQPDVRGELGARVFVSYEPRWASPGRPARPEHAVREHALLSPAQLAVGNLETSCEDCSELSARDALRIAAGRLGASDVVGVRCLASGTGQRCLGEAAVAERAE